jgi:hypothetical protein
LTGKTFPTVGVDGDSIWDAKGLIQFLDYGTAANENASVVKAEMF